MEKKLINRITVRLLIATIVILFILILLKSMLTKVPSRDNIVFTSVEDTLMKITSEWNKTCPFMVDRETRIDNAIVLPGNTLQYNYTLINCVKDSLNIDATKKGIEPGLINGVKTSPNLIPFRDNKVT
jgi:hypothetical protein